MNTFKKTYIGKGVQHETLDLVKVTLKMDEVIEHQHEFKGEAYITFEVAKLQQPDDYGRTHTAYVTTKESTPEATAKPKRKTQGSKK